MLLASGWVEGRHSATGKILQCIGLSTAKNYPGENISSAKAEKP